METKGRFGPKRAGVRLDAALVATLVVGAALAVGAIVLLSLTRSQLTQAVETTIVNRAQDLAASIESQGIPDQIQSTRGITVQIVNDAGAVVVSTPDIEGQIAMTMTVPPSNELSVSEIPAFEQGENQGEGSTDGEESDEEGPYLLAVMSVSETLPARVIVAASLRSVNEAVTTLRTLLMVGIPVVTLIVFATTWLLAGRTLRPVKAMTAEAERITLTGLERRIPLPPANDEIRELGETLNHMLTRLEGSVLRQRKFVADASHELKSPIASLITMSEVAQTHPETIDAPRLAGDVEIEARRLALLVDDLLTLARSDENAFSLDKTSFDLAELVREETAHIRLGGVNLDLGGLTAGKVYGDRRRIAQIIRNLLDNATTHAAGQIWVRTRKSDDYSELVVGDDGPGIPIEQRQRVFERFIRLDESRSRLDGGTGLGLAVTKALAEAHGGSVSFVDDPAHPGTTVIVRLPRT